MQNVADIKITTREKVEIGWGDWGGRSRQVKGGREGNLKGLVARKEKKSNPVREWVQKKTSTRGGG